MNSNSRELITIDQPKNVKMYGSGKLSKSGQYLSQSSSNVTKLSRDDSVTSKSSVHSLFPSLMRQNESVSINIPRPRRTDLFAMHLILTLKGMRDKYSGAKVNEDTLQAEEFNVTCSKLDDRISLLEQLLNEYESKKKEQEMELKKLENSINVASSNNDSISTETYYNLCQDMSFIESRFEKCSGRLQFQIINLEAISRINFMDQFELTVRCGQDQRFRTKIRIDKSGHQIWDSRSFTINPVIENEMQIKFSEIRTLNKTINLVDKTIPNISNLIQSEPSVFTVWLTPMGTIKLKVIVQWNGMLENVSVRNSTDDNVILRRGENGSQRSSQFRHSTNLENISRYFEHGFRSLYKKRSENNLSTTNIPEVSDENLYEKHSSNESDKESLHYDRDEEDEQMKLRREEIPDVISTNESGVVSVVEKGISEVCYQMIESPMVSLINLGDSNNSNVDSSAVSLVQPEQVLIKVEEWKDDNTDETECDTQDNDVTLVENDNETNKSESVNSGDEKIEVIKEECKLAEEKVDVEVKLEISPLENDSKNISEETEILDVLKKEDEDQLIITDVKLEEMEGEKNLEEGAIKQETDSTPSRLQSSPDLVVDNTMCEVANDEADSTIRSSVFDDKCKETSNEEANINTNSNTNSLRPDEVDPVILTTVESLVEVGEISTDDIEESGNDPVTHLQDVNNVEISKDPVVEKTL